MEAGASSHTMGAGSTSHPIGLIVTDDLRRSRLTVFFRLLLVIPHLIWLYLWSIPVTFAVVIAWFAALFTGRVPDGLHDFNASSCATRLASPVTSSCSRIRGRRSRRRSRIRSTCGSTRRSNRAG